MIVDNVLKILLIYIVFKLLGKGMQTSIALICFGSLRCQMGGRHMKSGWACLGMMILIVSVCIIYQNMCTKMSLIILMIVFIYGEIFIYNRVPNGNLYVELMTEKEKKKKKRNAMFLWIIWIIVAYFTTYRNLITGTIICTIVTGHQGRRGRNEKAKSL